jgi:ATP-dependent RNA helicase RhlE
MTFEQLNLSPLLLKAVAAEGYETPTPIQAQSIPTLLEGRDLLGIAQTGTGKTAAFALPMLELLMKDGKRPDKNSCRALILSPTRELCSQILESFRTYGANTKLKSTVVFGGVSLNKQIEAVRNGVDILVATPGRLVDLIDRRALTLSKVEIFVLDEVDQMLDLGFIHAIRKLTGMLPKTRQNLFFSATMPKEIAGLAAALLNDPVRVEIQPAATTAERVSQHVIHVDPANKIKLLVDVLRDPQITRALIFTRTKHGADKVVKALDKESYKSAAIHGNKSQANREKALAGFKDGKILALVATDIAARGIDVDGVSHVFNFDLPFVPESYVHRIGRTARAGAAGEAIAFCIPEDRGLLRDIEKTIRQAVPVKEHALGLKVDELAPNFGWDPSSANKRKSGGGRHMPKAGTPAVAKKPHHRGQPAKGMGPQHAVNGEPRPGVRADGRLQKREWNPVGMPTQAIDQAQFARKSEGDAAAPAERVRNDRPRTERTGERNGEHKAPPKFGDRKFGGGGKQGFGKPRGGGGAKSGNWMKSVGDKAKG